MYSPEGRERAVRMVLDHRGSIVGSGPKCCSILQSAMEINNLRNTRGAGHGRAEDPVNLTSRHGRLAAGAAHLVATLMFDTLDDESAPWRRRTAERDRP